MSPFFAIVGHGPNGLKIPLVVCQTKEEADTIVEQLPKAEDGWLDYDFVECDGRFADEEDDECQSDDEGRKLYRLIFKNGSYYPGCGSCYRVSVEEFTFGQPMVAWDLD